MEVTTLLEIQEFTFIPNREIKAKRKTRWNEESRDKKRYKKKQQRKDKWEIYNE